MVLLKNIFSRWNAFSFDIGGRSFLQNVSICVTIFSSRFVFLPLSICDHVKSLIHFQKTYYSVILYDIILSMKFLYHCECFIVKFL